MLYKVAVSSVPFDTPNCASTPPAIIKFTSKCMLRTNEVEFLKFGSSATNIILHFPQHKIYKTYIIYTMYIL